MSVSEPSLWLGWLSCLMLSARCRRAQSLSLYCYPLHVTFDRLVVAATAMAQVVVYHACCPMLYHEAKINSYAECLSMGGRQVPPRFDDKVGEDALLSLHGRRMHKAGVNVVCVLCCASGVLYVWTCFESVLCLFVA